MAQRRTARKGDYVVDGVLYRAGRRLWTAEEDAVVRELYADIPTELVAAQLDRPIASVYVRAKQLGLKKSPEYIARECGIQPGDTRGRATQFRPGHVPANKGVRRPGWAPGRMKETQFKTGERRGAAARRWMPVGSTRLMNGYVYRKVSDIQNVPYTVNWKLEHLLVWESAHGPVPPQHVIVFRNKDACDIRLENLECISRTELMRRNSVHNLPPPLKQTVQLLGVINRHIRRRLNHAAEEHDRRPTQSPVRDPRTAEGRRRPDGHHARSGGRRRGESDRRECEGRSGLYEGDGRELGHKVHPDRSGGPAPTASVATRTGVVRR